MTQKHVTCLHALEVRPGSCYSSRSALLFLHPEFVIPLFGLNQLCKLVNAQGVPQFKSLNQFGTIKPQRLPWYSS